MQHNTCDTVYWSTSCNIWHPLKDLGSHYCNTCSPMEQLSSMHQQWFHILPHVEAPLWMQCQSSQHCPKWHNCHIPGSVKTPLHSGTTCITPTCTTPAAPATLATQMKQAPAVPATPAVQKNALAPMPATSHATPVQPQRSGHAHMAPKCLIQEIWELLTWTVHGLCFHNALLHTSPVNCCSKLPCNIFSERGMSYDHFI